MKKAEAQQININSVLVEIKKEETGYFAVALGVPGLCTTEAKTYEKVVVNMQEALRGHFECLKENKNKMETRLVKSEYMQPIYLFMPVPEYA